MIHSDIYKMIKNPLDDERIMDEIINVYGEASSYYNGLIKVFSKDKDMRYSITESDRLHAGLFNKWKHHLLSITKEQYEDAIKRGLFDKSIYKLLDLLRKTPDVKTKKEADTILFEEYDDEELQSAIDNYSWSGDQMEWTHIRKRKITGKKVNNFPVEHRLYLNVDSKYLHAISRHFINKCESKGLNYYFKIAEYDRRDDTMVVYSDSKNLPNYIQVLEEIRKEHPELTPAFGEPTLLAGRINSWIGYGSENLSEKKSFNELRSQVIDSAIKSTMNDWYKVNQHRTFKYKGKILTFNEYVAKRLVEEQVKTAKRIYAKNPNAKYLDLTKEQITDPKFLASHEKKIASEIAPLITSSLYKTPANKKIVYKSGDRENKIITFDVTSTLRKIAPEIIKADPQLRKKIKERIIKEASLKGIDTNKFCFDKKNKELLEQIVSQPQKKPEQTPSKPQYQGYVYKPMTDEEIEESRRKIGEYVPPKKQPEERKPQDYVHRPMTDEEIEESRRKIGEYNPPKTRPIEEILKNVNKRQPSKEETPIPRKQRQQSSSYGNVAVNQNGTTINQTGTINQNGGINIINVGTININVPPRYAFEQGKPKVINSQKKKDNQKVKTK